MKPSSLSRLLTLAASVGLLTFGAVQSQAQNQNRGGRGDPEQFRARMMERFREDFKVTSDDEWKLIEGRINAVMEARRDLGGLTPRGRGFGGRGGRGPDAAGGGGNNGGRRGGDNADAGADRGGRRGGPPGFGEPAPQVQALEKAVEGGSADDIKSKLASLRTARKEGEAKLSKAQDDLRKVLSVSQEGHAVLAGLLE